MVIELSGWSTTKIGNMELPIHIECDCMIQNCKYADNAVNIIELLYGNLCAPARSLTI